MKSSIVAPGHGDVTDEEKHITLFGEQRVLACLRRSRVWPPSWSSRGMIDGATGSYGYLSHGRRHLRVKVLPRTSQGVDTGCHLLLVPVR